MAKLCRFYCVDCDAAWAEILGDDLYTALCEYCRKPQEAEICSDN